MTKKRGVPYPDALPEILPAWKTADVLGTARSIKAERAFDRLPVLSDALMDAGCDDREIIDHLRGAWRHCYCCTDGVIQSSYAAGPAACPVCRGHGRLREDELHTRASDGRQLGCWERECWLVNHILAEPQPVRAAWPRRDRRAWAVDDVSAVADDRYAHDFVTGSVVNQGDHYGYVWAVTVANCYDPPVYLVEAAGPGDAEEDFIDSPWGENERLSTEEQVEYEREKWDVQWTGSGTPYSGENIHVEGREIGSHNGADIVPFPCLYYGPGLPKQGIDPRLYAAAGECELCGRPVYPGFNPPNISGNPATWIGRITGPPDFCARPECQTWKRLREAAYPEGTTVPAVLSD